MTRAETLFAVEVGPSSEQAVEALERGFSLGREDLDERPLTYYDSFDWRIFTAGGNLTAIDRGGEVEISWHKDDGASLHQCRLRKLPAFVWDLPPGRLRDDLTPILKMRRLLPVVEVKRRGQLLRVLDREEKTVARVVIEEAFARAPGGGGETPLASYLRLLPVRGYAKAQRKVLRLIEGELGLERVDHHELTHALAAIGVSPEIFSSKVMVRLDPAQRADEAVLSILHTLLEAMLANEDGTRQDLDSEFLHDFRVAGRRTRSALTQIKGVLPPADVERFKSEFAWLGGVTGATRDLDVYLLKMPEYEASLPESVRRDLGPLKEFLEHHQRLEQRKLVQTLDSRRYQRLIRDWSAYLEQPAAEPVAGQFNAGRPIVEIGSERIWKTYRKVAKEGRAIGPETPAEALHDLRIRCKKLRYLLEFFRSLYPAKKIGPLIASLKKLQDNLGDFNDYEVQQGALAEFARQMRDEGETPVETLLAMGRLVDHLETGQHNERLAFHERFALFDAAKNQAFFRRLFQSKGGQP